MQRITLRPFGPIQDVEIDVTDIIVFIGPQASGKSTISKAIYFFKSLKDDLIKYVLEAMETKKFAKPLGTYAKRVRSKFLDFWGPSYALGDFFLEYDYGNGATVRIAMKENYVNPDFNPDFKKHFHSIVREASEFTEKNAARSPTYLSSSELLAIEAQKRVFFKRIEALAIELFNDRRDHLFIPAGRSLVATLSDQLSSVQPKKLDFVMKAFIDRINNTKPLFSKSFNELIRDRRKLTQEEIPSDYLDVAQEIIQNIMRGTYRYDSDGEKLFYDKVNYTKLNYASSGQQESIWILLLIFLMMLEFQEVFIVFEEPEAHLYPEAQQEMVHLTALLVNLIRNRPEDAIQNQVVLTTHSPYILSALNNLLYAHRIGMTNPLGANNVLDHRLWLAPSRLRVFFVDKGKATEIMDEETGLIKAEKIDSASEKINKTYDKLFELDV